MELRGRRRKVKHRKNFFKVAYTGCYEQVLSQMMLKTNISGGINKGVFDAHTL